MNQTINISHFIGLDESEWNRINATRSIIESHASLISEQIYKSLLSSDDTRQYFINESGNINHVIIEQNKKRIEQWLISQFNQHTSGQIGKIHNSMGVPMQYIIGTISVIQSYISNTLDYQDSRAWNKLLMLQLSEITSVYK